MSGKRHRRKAKLVPPRFQAPEPRHCDEYIDDPTAPPVLRTWLARARMPAHGMLVDAPYPKLFADFEGRRVRVVVASRFGDRRYI